MRLSMCMCITRVTKCDQAHKDKNTHAFANVHTNTHTHKHSHGDQGKQTLVSAIFCQQQHLPSTQTGGRRWVKSTNWLIMISWDWWILLWYQLHINWLMYLHTLETFKQKGINSRKVYLTETWRQCVWTHLFKDTYVQRVTVNIWLIHRKCNLCPNVKCMSERKREKKK